MKKWLALLLTLALALGLTGLTAAPAAAEDEKVSIEAYVVSPWVTSELPPEEEDIYKNYIQDKFGINFKLSFSADGETELLTRFTSGNAPDLIAFNGFTSLWKFYEQGVLLDDWSDYLDDIQPFVSMMGQDQLTYFTRDEKVVAVATQPGQQTFAWMIRQDWLDTLGLEMPTSLDELYDVLHAFTFSDPDQNGENDTYGITSAGGGASVGEIYNLINFLGRPGFYLGDDGAVSHPVVDGTLKEYLDYLKKLYDAGVIDPNWYTQGWEERKAELFAGTYGMCWYPPDALLDENYGSRKDEVADGWWNVLPMFSGALPSTRIIGNSVLTVSADCAQDDAKMQKVFDMMNTFITPNDEYYELRRSANIDGTHLIRQDNGTAYVWRDVENIPYKQLDSVEGAYIATAVYGQLFGTYSDGYYGGLTEEISAHVVLMMELVSQVKAMPYYSAEDQFLALDATTVEEANMVFQEFCINYVLGVDSDYDTFVQNWLDAGGQALLDQATEQLQAYGFID